MLIKNLISDRDKAAFFRLLVVLIFVIFIPSAIFAQGYGISGEVGFIYERDETESGNSSSEFSSFEQRYKLNYRNFIYKPQLLEYNIGGTFKKEDGKADGSSVEAKSTEYDLRLNVLNRTPYAFSLWTTKQTPTSLSTVNNEGVFVKQEIESYGIEGGLYLQRLPSIRYSFKQEDKDTSGLTEPLSVRERKFTLNVSKLWKKSKIEANYEYDSELDKITSSIEKSHDFWLSGNTSRKISQYTDLEANAIVHRNTLSDTTEFKTTSVFDYKPSDRFKGKATTNYNHTIQSDEDGDNFSTNLDTWYKLSRVFSVTGNTSFIYNTGYYGNNTAESLGGTINYSDTVAKETILSANYSLGFGAHQGEPYNKTTVNTSLSSSLTKNFTAIRSSLSTSGLVNYYSSSAGGKSELFNIGITGLSQFIDRLTATSLLKYEQEKTTGDTVDSIAGSTTSTDKLTSDTSLAYFFFLGWRGRVDLKSGLLIEQGSTDRESFYADGTIKYFVLRNLSASANTRYQYEGIPSSDTISFSGELKYRIRSIFVTLRHEWRKEKLEDSSTKATHTRLEVVRPF
jgi:hypothetical protein